MAGRGGLVLPKFVVRGDPFGAELKRRLDVLVNGVEAQLTRAAKTATNVSRADFATQRSRRPFVPARPGRSTTQGRFEQDINWNPQRRADGNLVVSLDVDKLEAATPTHYGGRGYWLIQEIGTGREATMRVGGAPRYQRQSMVEVRSQIGRLIPNTLAWQSSGGVLSAAQAARYGQDQLAAAAAATRRAGTAVVIGREIQGKHYVRDGGFVGFNQFESNALVAAKQAFAGRERR